MILVAMLSHDFLSMFFISVGDWMGLAEMQRVFLQICTVRLYLTHTHTRTVYLMTKN